MLRAFWNRIPMQIFTAFVAFALVLSLSLDADAKKKKKKKRGKRAKAAQVNKNENGAGDGENEGVSLGSGVDMVIDSDEIDSTEEEPVDEVGEEEEEPEPEDQEEDEGAGGDVDAADDEKETEEEGSKESTSEENDSKESEEEEVVDLEVDASSDGASTSGILADTFESEAVVRRDRGINILTAHATRKGALTLVLDHRPYKNLFSGAHAFHDYLGLDRGESLKVGLGLRYGIIDGLDFGIYRLNDGGLVNYDTYEFDLRYVFLNQKRFFVNLMLRAGGSWFVEEDEKDGFNGFAQLFVDHVLFDRVLIGAGFAFHGESSSEYKERDERLDKDLDAFSGAITGVLEWRAFDILAVTAEIAAPVVGYKQDYPSATLALKFLTHRHTFSVMLTTAQFISADGIVTGTWRSPKELVFGFQIFREFNLADY